MARTLLLRLAVALLAALTAALGGQARADIVRLAVASNFAEPMQTLAEAFSAGTGHTLIISNGSTGRQLPSANFAACRSRHVRRAVSSFSMSSL